MALKSSLTEKYNSFLSSISCGQSVSIHLLTIYTGEFHRFRSYQGTYGFTWLRSGICDSLSVIERLLFISILISIVRWQHYNRLFHPTYLNYIKMKRHIQYKDYQALIHQFLLVNFTITFIHPDRNQILFSPRGEDISLVYQFCEWFLHTSHYDTTQPLLSGSFRL